MYIWCPSNIPHGNVTLTPFLQIWCNTARKTFHSVNNLYSKFPKLLPCFTLIYSNVCISEVYVSQRYFILLSFIIIPVFHDFVNWFFSLWTIVGNQSKATNSTNAVLINGTDYWVHVCQGSWFIIPQMASVSIFKETNIFSRALLKIPIYVEKDEKCCSKSEMQHNILITNVLGFIYQITCLCSIIQNKIVNSAMHDWHAVVPRSGHCVSENMILMT